MSELYTKKEVVVRGGSAHGSKPYPLWPKVASDRKCGPMLPFDEIQVPEDLSQSQESLGSKPKFWYFLDGKWHIFKQSRPGEDWSEKVASELAAALKIPHATVEFAVCGAKVS